MFTSEPAADDGSEKRSARMPAGPPHPRRGGVGQTLRRTLAEFKEDELTDRAAGLTYYAVLAIFPALIALVSIVGLIASPTTITRQLTDLVRKLGPSSAVHTFAGPIAGIAHSRSTAGITLVVGLVAALWSASAYVGAFTRSANVIYEVEEGRGLLKLRPLQLLVTLVQVLLLAMVLLALALTGPIAAKVGSAIGAGTAAVTAWNIAKWPVLLVVVIGMIALLYYASPNARIRGFRKVLPGTVLAVIVWLVASAGFAFFVSNFGSYNKTYGTLAGVVVFLVWLWLTNLAILFGAEFNAERERSHQLDHGEPGAERELQIPERTPPKPEKRSRTA